MRKPVPRNVGRVPAEVALDRKGPAVATLYFAPRIIKSASARPRAYRSAAARARAYAIGASGIRGGPPFAALGRRASGEGGGRFICAADCRIRGEPSAASGGSGFPPRRIYRFRRRTAKDAADRVAEILAAREGGTGARGRTARLPLFLSGRECTRGTLRCAGRLFGKARVAVIRRALPRRFVCDARRSLIES